MKNKIRLQNPIAIYLDFDERQKKIWITIAIQSPIAIEREPHKPPGDTLSGWLDKED